MTIESIELSNTGLPNGYSTEYSNDFGGDLVIREGGLLAGVSMGGDEKGVFKAVFKGNGVVIYESWIERQNQIEIAEGGEDI